jgi:WXG100 family type VII secretion target
MSNKIVVNIMRFDAASTGISRVSNELKDSKDSLKRCNAILSDKWKGKSSEKFFNAYNSLDENFDVYLKELDKLVKTLDNITNAFIEKDNNLKKFIEENTAKSYGDA